MSWESDDGYNEAARVYKPSAKEWQRNKAATQRRRDITIESRMGYEQIIFPDADGCRHAALVVCGYVADEPSPVAAAREILEALALPTILAEGGDGRVLRVQRGPLRMECTVVDDIPLGYGPDDYGRPDARPKGR